MKKIWLLLSLVVFLFGFVGCKEDDGEPKETPPELTSLVGTKWKLVGFFDVEKNELIEAEPKDCGSCYTLKFIDDSTFGGQTASNVFMEMGIVGDWCTYSIDCSTGKFNFTNIVATKVGETGHGEIYFNTLFKVNSFTVENIHQRILRLWYNDGKNYLKYKEIGDGDEG